MATAKISLVISESSVSVANNTSVVTAKLYYYGNGVSWANGGCSGYITIDGTKYTFSGATIKTSTSAQLISTKSKTVTHNTNGAKTVSVAAQLVTPTSDAGTLTTSAKKTLTTIARASTITANKTTVPADGTSTITVTATKKSSSFTDTIVVTLGSYSQTVTSGTAFTIPATWINAISGTSATAKATVTTKSGTTTIGTNNVSFTVTVPSTVVPTISSVTASEAVSAVSTAFGSGIYVTTLSKLNIAVTAAGIYKSSISSVKTTFDGITYTSASFQTSKPLSKAGTLTITATATDSRGRSVTNSATKVTVYEYFTPIITSISCVSSGTNTIVKVTGSIAPVTVGTTAKNTKTLKISYRKAGETAWTTGITATPSAWNFSYSNPFALDSTTTTYEFKVDLIDKIRTTSNPVTDYGTTGKPVISRKAGGTGVTLFGEAAKDGFVINDAPMDIIGDTNKLTTANNLQVYSLGGNILIPSGSDLNDYAVPGNYYGDTGNVSNCPISVSGTLFYVKVSKQYGVATAYIEQELTIGSTFRKYYRRSADGGSTWGSWVKWFYEAGNTIDVSAYVLDTAGFISSSSTKVYFTVPVSRPILGTPTITASSVNGFVLRQRNSSTGGSYTHGSASDTYVKPSSYVAVIMPGGDSIRICATFSTTTNAVNNSPIGIQWSGKITLS